MPSEQTARARTIRICARATLSELEAALQACPDPAGFAELRAPESGLVMLRARIGGVGNAFNVGEATVTRAVVRVPDGRTGFGFVMGRSPERARRSALVEAFAQDPALHANLEPVFFRPVEDRLAREAKARSEKVAATRVDFFTLVRGENE